MISSASMLRCFMSYPSEHKHHAQFLKDRIGWLYPENVEVFLASDPSSLPPGRIWYDTILQNLEQSDIVLVLLAPSFAGSPWIMFEAGTAVALGKKLVPLRYAGLTAQQVPGPLIPNQSLGLTQQNEVRELLLDLATSRRPAEARLKDATRAITRYFVGLETAQAHSDHEDFPILPLAERIQLLTLASPTQRDLFFHVRAAGTEGILESEIREALPIRYNRHGEEGDPDLLISPSEYYFRLRELFFCGLVEMEKVSFHENRWTVRDEIRMALYRTPVWGAPRLSAARAQQEPRKP
jgi:hypothetical protein